MKDSPIIVSACLAGLFCRYNGDMVPCEPIIELVKTGKAIPFCPEAMGGLPTPRPPCEILDGRVINKEGVDQTDEFRLGAEQGLKLAQMIGCKKAILKSGSPSCGNGTIYDGTFSGVRVPGNGFFAELLIENGIAVYSEEDL